MKQSANKTIRNDRTRLPATGFSNRETGLPETPEENPAGNSIPILSGVHPLSDGDSVVFELQDCDTGRFLYLEKGPKKGGCVEISLYRDKRCVRIMPLCRTVILNLHTMQPGRYTLVAMGIVFFRFELVP